MYNIITFAFQLDSLAVPISNCDQGSVNSSVIESIIRDIACNVSNVHYRYGVA